MDPREAKLPKWAQIALEAERRKADLGWPTEAEPAPIYETIGEGQFGGTKPPDGTQVWVTSKYGSPVEVELRRGHCFRLEARSGESGSRPMQGAKFYATRDDALLASWWAACHAASREIHHRANLYRRR